MGGLTQEQADYRDALRFSEAAREVNEEAATLKRKAQRWEPRPYDRAAND